VLPRPLRSLPWASPAPSPSSPAPWTPPRGLRVSREAPAAALPWGPLLPWGQALVLARGPALTPSFCPRRRAPEHGRPNAEGDASAGPGQPWAAGEAGPGGWRTGLSPRSSHGPFGSPGLRGRHEAPAQLPRRPGAARHEHVRPGCPQLVSTGDGGGGIPKFSGQPAFCLFCCPCWAGKLRHKVALSP
jgi:hypothetical protein